MVLAYFIECSCPPDRRSATVGAGDLTSVVDFLKSYPLNHIVCQTCDSYYELIGWIDEAGTEYRANFEPRSDPRRKGKRLTSSGTRSGRL